VQLSALFKGPGWAPGKPRLGLPEDIPVVHYPHPFYDPKVPTIVNIYVLVCSQLLEYAECSGGMRDPAHEAQRVPRVLLTRAQIQYAGSLALYVSTLAYSKQFSATAAVISSLYILLSLTAYGGVFDRRRWAVQLEIVRLVIPLAYIAYADGPPTHARLRPRPALLMDITRVPYHHACRRLAAWGVAPSVLTVLPAETAEKVRVGIVSFYGLSLLFVLGRASIYPFLGPSRSLESLPPAPRVSKGTSAAATAVAASGVAPMAAASPPAFPAYARSPPPRAAATAAAAAIAATPTKLVIRKPKGPTGETPKSPRSAPKSPRSATPTSPRSRTRSAKSPGSK